MSNSVIWESKKNILNVIYRNFYPACWVLKIVLDVLITRILSLNSSIMNIGRVHFLFKGFTEYFNYFSLLLKLENIAINNADWPDCSYSTLFIQACLSTKFGKLLYLYVMMDWTSRKLSFSLPNFCSHSAPSANSRRAVVSLWQNYVYKVLANRLED